MAMTGAIGMQMAGNNALYGSENAVNRGLNVAVSPTLSSAVSKVDGINTRLLEAIKQLQAIHDQIGGPRAVSTESSKGQIELSGAVGRLNSSAERSHEHLSELEGLLSLVARSLG
jgi:hypothetical protein